jgi:hypothetical protein
MQHSSFIELPRTSLDDELCSIMGMPELLLCPLFWTLDAMKHKIVFL